tara:strand:+ start:48 stop:194 length:147 start_codon:yes stop_codon:yes gene_type:complete
MSAKVNISLGIARPKDTKKELYMKLLFFFKTNTPTIKLKNLPKATMVY